MLKLCCFRILIIVKLNQNLLGYSPKKESKRETHLRQQTLEVPQGMPGQRQQHWKGDRLTKVVLPHQSSHALYHLPGVPAHQTHTKLVHSKLISSASTPCLFAYRSTSIDNYKSADNFWLCPCQNIGRPKGWLVG